MTATSKLRMRPRRPYRPDLGPEAEAEIIAAVPDGFHVSIVAPRAGLFRLFLFLDGETPPVAWVLDVRTPELLGAVRRMVAEAAAAA